MPQVNEIQEKQSPGEEQTKTMPLKVIINPFKKILKDVLRDYYHQNLDIKATEKGFLEKFVTGTTRKGAVNIAAGLGGVVAEAAGGNQVVAAITGYTIRAAAILYFHFKDKSEQEKIEAAKIFIDDIEKLGGIEEIANLVADYIAGRFFYLLLALWEAGGDNYQTLANFFADVTIDIIYKNVKNYNFKKDKTTIAKIFSSVISEEIKQKNQQVFLELLADNIIPEHKSNLYREDFFGPLITRKISIVYNLRTISLQEILIKSPVIDPAGHFIIRPNSETEYPPQYIESDIHIQNLGYNRNIQFQPFPRENKEGAEQPLFLNRPEIIQEVNLESASLRESNAINQESLKHYLSEYYHQHLKQHGKAVLSPYRYLYNRKLLVEKINANKSFKNELFNCVNELYGFYFRLIDGLNIDLLSAEQFALLKFLANESKWLANLNTKAKDPRINNCLNYIEHIIDYLRSIQRSEDLIMANSIYKIPINSYLSYLHENSERTIKNEIYQFIETMEGVNLLKGDEKEEQEINEKSFIFLLNTLLNPAVSEEVQSTIEHEEVEYGKVNKILPQERMKLHRRILKKIKDPAELEKVLVGIAKSYSQSVVLEILETRDEEEKFFLEYLLNEQDRSQINYRKSIELLIKFGVNPLVVLHKFLNNKIEQDLNKIWQYLKSEILPNPIELSRFVGSLRMVGSLGDSKKTAAAIRMLIASKNTNAKLEKLISLYEKKPSFFWFLWNFICLPNSHIRKVIGFDLHDSGSIPISLNDLEKAMMSDSNEAGITVFTHCLIVGELDLCRTMITKLGALLRLRLDESVYRNCNDEVKKEITIIAEHIFRWARILAGKLTFSDSLLEEHEKHKKYDSIYIILHALKYPIGTFGETALFRIIASKDSRRLLFLKNIFGNLRGNDEIGVPYIATLYDIITSSFVGSEKIYKVGFSYKNILRLNPITFSIVVGNIAAFTLFKDIITCYVLKILLGLDDKDKKSYNDKYFIEEMRNIFDSQDSLGGIALCYAALFGQIQIIKLLLNEIHLDPYTKIVLEPRELLENFHESYDGYEILTKVSLDWILTQNSKGKQKNDVVLEYSITSGIRKVYSIFDYINASLSHNKETIRKMVNEADTLWFKFYEQKFSLGTNPHYYAPKLIATGSPKVRKIKNRNNQTPIDVIKANNYNAYIGLFNNNFSSTDDELFYRLASLSADSLNLLLRKRPNLSTYQYDKGTTLLMSAVIHQRYDLLVALMVHGAGLTLPFKANKKIEVTVKDKDDAGNKTIKSILPQMTVKDLAADDKIAVALLNQTKHVEFFQKLNEFSALYHEITCRKLISFSTIRSKLKLLINSLPEDSFDREDRYINKYINHEGNTIFHICLNIYHAATRLVEFNKDDSDFIEFSRNVEKFFQKLIFIEPIKNCRKDIKDKVIFDTFKKNQCVLTEHYSIKKEPNIKAPKFLVNIISQVFTQKERVITSKKLKKLAIFISFHADLSTATFYSAKGYSLLQILALHGEWQAFDHLIKKIKLTVDLRDIYLDPHNDWHQDDKSPGLPTLYYLCCWPNQGRRIEIFMNLFGSPKVNATKKDFSLSVFLGSSNDTQTTSQPATQNEAAAEYMKSKEGVIADGQVYLAFLDQKAELKRSGSISSKSPTTSSKRTKLVYSNEVDKKITQAIHPNFEVGSVIQEDSFFDALSQSITQLKLGQVATIKSLRAACCSYAKNPSHEVELREILAKTTESYDIYIENISYTLEEIEEKTKQKQDAKFIPGRLHIEGQILCGAQGLQLHVLEVLEKAPDGVTIQEKIIDSSGESFMPQVSSFIYQNPKVVHLVSYREKFIPIINKLQHMQSQIRMSSFFTVKESAKINHFTDENESNWKPVFIKDQVLSGIVNSIKFCGGTTPLIIAARLNNEDSIVPLIGKCDVTYKDQSGHSALYYALNVSLSVDKLTSLSKMLFDVTAIKYFFSEHMKKEIEGQERLLLKYNEAIKMYITSRLQMEVNINSLEGLKAYNNKLTENLKKSLALIPNSVTAADIKIDDTFKNSGFSNGKIKIFPSSFTASQPIPVPKTGRDDPAQDIGNSTPKPNSLKKGATPEQSSTKNTVDEKAKSINYHNSLSQPELLNSYLNLPEAPNYLLTQDENFVTVLELSIAVLNDLPLFEKILKISSADYTNKEGTSLLRYALVMEKFDKVELLLKYGAPVNYIDLCIAANLSNLPLNIANQLTKTYIQQTFSLEDIQDESDLSDSLSSEGESSYESEDIGQSVSYNKHTNAIVQTLGNGNCAFNAVALGLCDLIIQGKLNSNSSEFIEKLMISLTNDNNFDNFRGRIANMTNFQKQIKFAPLLRQLALEHIKQHYEQFYKDSYEETLIAAYHNYDRNRIEDDNFMLHAHIRSKFSESKLSAAALRTWWGGRGKTEYFNNLSNSATDATDHQSWGSEIEINALASLFGVNIHCEKNQETMSVGIGRGIIKGISEEEIYLLNNLGIIDRLSTGIYIKYYFTKQEQLQAALSPVPEAIRFFVNELLNKNIGTFPDTIKEMTEFTKEEVIEILKRRNVITIRDNRYDFIKCNNRPDKAQIEVRLNGLLATSEKLKQEVIKSYMAEVPEFTVRHQGEHWMYVRSREATEEVRRNTGKLSRKNSAKNPAQFFSSSNTAISNVDSAITQLSKQPSV